MGGGWNWGNAGSGAMSGAATGTAIMPGWGTAIGGAAGGLMGGLTGGKGKTKAPDFNAAAMNQNNYSTPWATVSGNNLTLGGQGNEIFNNLQTGMNAASTMDPTKARDQAVNQNLNYGMSVLQPQLGMMDQGFRSSVANTGSTPQQQLLENKMLGDQKASLTGNVYTNALNMGNQTQQTQMAQQRQPFDLYNNFIGASLQRPTSPNLLGAAALQYGAGKDASSVGQANQQGLLSGIGGIGRLFGGKGSKGGSSANGYNAQGYGQWAGPGGVSMGAGDFSMGT